MEWWKSNWRLFFISMLSALAVTMDLNVAEAPDAGITIGLYQQIYKLVMILVTDIEKRGFLLSLLTLLFWGAYWYIWKKMRIEIIKYSKGLSLFLALMYTAGNSSVSVVNSPGKNGYHGNGILYDISDWNESVVFDI